MTMMAVLARPVVDLNFSGWQMAYQRSMEIDVSVITETVTETVCEHVRKKHKNRISICGLFENRIVLVWFHEVPILPSVVFLSLSDMSHTYETCSIIARTKLTKQWDSELTEYFLRITFKLVSFSFYAMFPTI